MPGDRTCACGRAAAAAWVWCVVWRGGLSCVLWSLSDTKNRCADGTTLPPTTAHVLAGYVCVRQQNGRGDTTFAIQHSERLTRYAGATRESAPTRAHNMLGSTSNKPREAQRRLAVKATTRRDEAQRPLAASPPNCSPSRNSSSRRGNSPSCNERQSSTRVAEASRRHASPQARTRARATIPATDEAQTLT